MDTTWLSPEYAEQLEMTLARSTTLVHLHYEHFHGDPYLDTPVLFDSYCIALSKNTDTKLERLRLVLSGKSATSCLMDAWDVEGYRPRRH